MSIAIVQTAKSAVPFGNSSPQTVVFANPVASHNTVIVAVAIQEITALALSAPTDSAGNTYHTAFNVGAAASAVGMALFYAYDVVGGSAFTVSDALPTFFCSCGPGVDPLAMIAYEVSGLTATDPLDKFHTAGGASGANPSSGNTQATTVANELLFGVFVENQDAPVVTAGGGFSNFLSEGPAGGAAGAFLATETQIVSATGAYAAPFTATGTFNWRAGIATFKAAPSPTVTGIAPSSGTSAGGTSVVINGTNLAGASAVKFGTNLATGVVVNSTTQITCNSPAGSGTVDATVTTPGGTSSTSGADQFTYIVIATPGVAYGSVRLPQQAARGDHAAQSVAVQTAPVVAAVGADFQP